MPRAPLRLAAATIVAAAAILSTSAAAVRAADDEAAADTFRQAELAERGLGDLDRAAALYRQAGLAAANPDVRARAEIRAASCLRRLGRSDEARALLEQIAAPRPGVSAAVRAAAAAELTQTDASPPLAVPAAAPSGEAAARLAETQRERDQSQQALEKLLDQTKGYQAEIATLAGRVRELDAELAKRRAEAPSPVPETAEEVLALRLRQRRDAEEQSRLFVKVARAAHDAGQFDEARRYLFDALGRNPDDADAKALLTRVSEPLGDREALFEHALELAALAREVRAVNRSAEVAALADEARRRQLRGDFAGASAPLEKALATIDADPGLVRGGAALRDEILRMLQSAMARGVARAPADPPAADPVETRWRDAMRDVLADAGREIAQGLDLRFHDLGSVVSATGLPPVAAGKGREPTGWTVSVVGVEPAPLVAAWLRASEPQTFAAPGASVTLVGSTCAILADLDTHKRIAERLAALRRGTPPAAEIVIGAYRMDRATVAAALGARGVQSVALADGVRTASLDAADLGALLGVMRGDAKDVVGIAALRATPLRAFRLSAW